MKHRVLYLLAALVLFATGNATAQSEKEMAEWMAMATPNTNHEILKLLEGTWKMDWSYQMTADQPGEKGTGTAEHKMILGGRFIQMDGIIDMMGQKMKTLQFIGYDNRKSEYFNLGMDEFGTYAMFCSGKYDKTKKKLIFNGKDLDPVTKKEYPYRIEITFVDKNKITNETFITNGSKEFRMMELVFTK
jgi:hypothetical protein